MEASDLTYIGSHISDRDIFQDLPESYRRLLLETNGFIAFDGGLHIRGAVVEPEWHSLRYVWRGDFALYKLFTNLRSTDIPFGQDYIGDQFILREEKVYRLTAENGELEDLETDLDGFLRRSEENPVDFLTLRPLLQFQSEGGKLQPGQLLNAFPPYILKESENGVVLRAVPMFEQIGFLADFADQIFGVPDGVEIKLRVVDSAGQRNDSDMKGH
jgi:hypothetical protein